MTGAKRILYINSYHEGYAPSDEIETAISAGLKSKGHELQTFHLNAKHATQGELAKHASELWAIYEKFKPDIVLTSDDNAIQTFIIPYLEQIDVPVLFCGVNWSSDRYHLPKEKVSGILEVLPVEECISLIRRSGYPLSTITVLSEQSPSEEKNKTYLVPLFQAVGLQVRYVMVNNVDSWKKEFKLAQHDSSALFLPTNGAIEGWNAEQITSFVLQESKVPSFTCDDFMIPYCAFGITKVAREQGEWIVAQTNAVLAGAHISGIPVEKNKIFRCLRNDPLSGKCGIQPSLLNCNSNLHAN